MAAKNMIRRKKYLILIKFQLKYIMYILFFLYVGAAVAGYTVYWTTWVTLGEKLANVYPRGRLIYIFHAANVTLLVRIMLITPLFILLGIFLSHRIAGPIYRLGKYIEMLMKGDYSQGIKLRKKDELKGLAHKMGELRNRLQQDREEREKVLDGIEKTIKESKLPKHVFEKISSDLKKMRK